MFYLILEIVLMSDRNSDVLFILYSEKADVFHGRKKNLSHVKYFLI